jgi:chromosome segregation ATPase
VVGLDWEAKVRLLEYAAHTFSSILTSEPRNVPAIEALRNVRVQRRALREELAALRCRLKELKGRLKEQEVLRATHARRTEERDALQREVDALAEHEAKAKEIRDELERLRAKLERAEADLLIVVVWIAKLQAIERQLETATIDVERLDKDVRGKEEEAIPLRAFQAENEARLHLSSCGGLLFAVTCLALLHCYPNSGIARADDGTHFRARATDDRAERGQNRA